MSFSFLTTRHIPVVRMRTLSTQLGGSILFEERSTYQPRAENDMEIKDLEVYTTLKHWYLTFFVLS